MTPRAVSLLGAALALLTPVAAAAQCTSGWVPCGVSHCNPVGTVCCASVGREEGYCNAGQVCTTDGKCFTPSSAGGGAGGGSGSSGTCRSTETLTQASCGGDTCSCAASCARSADCASGCCSGGFCANSCVCLGSGTVDYACGGTTFSGGGGGSGSSGEAPRWGCGSLGPTAALPWLALAVLAARRGGRRRAW